MESRRIVRRGHSRPPLLSVVFLLAQIVLPLASPFVVGTPDGTPSVTTLPKRQQHVAAVAKSTPRSIRTAAGVVMHMSSTTAASSDNRKRGLRKFLTHLIPSSGASDNTWRGGEHNATAASRLLFRYASPLLNLASKRQLDVDDAFEVPSTRKMGTAVPKLASIYDKCRSKARKRMEQQKQEGDVQRIKTSQSLILAKALLLHQRRTLLLTGILRLINTAVQAFPALLVARLLRLVESGEDQPASKAVGAAVALVAVLLVKMITENQYFHNIVKSATQVRGAIAGLIYDKSLRLPSGGGGVIATSSEQDDKKKKKAKSLGAGGVLNLMQSDASILESTALQLHTIWDGPLQIAVYTTLLYKYLGPSVIWGIGVLLLTIPLNSITLRLLNRLSKYENAAKDARTKRTTESIANMKLLKLQAWEDNFADDVRTSRREELRRHISRGVVRAVNSAISNAVPTFVLVVTLAAYAKTGKPVVASTIFTAISLFNQLRFPLFFYPMLIDSLANGENALRRVSSYLSSEEITPYVHMLPLLDGEAGSIEMKDGNFLWSTSSKPLRDGEASTSAAPALCDVDLKVNPGEVVAVIGPVGSGKTALIKSLLGELNPVPRIVVDQSLGESSTESTALGIMEVPSVVAHGNISYCSQEAWLPKGTIREAVVFGRDYDEERYMAALRDAGLDTDIVEGTGGANSKGKATNGVLSHDTDVGEGGSSLSGGQRARVALARALYGSDTSKVYLLDDCLAALDASVGSTVFDRVTKRLRNTKAATVFVTNDSSLPRRCDRVVLMGKYSAASPSCSTIIDAGTYDELIARGHDLRSITTEDTDLEEEEEEEEEEEVEEEALIPEPVIERASMVSIGGKDTIRIVGGYEVPINDTIRTCHADPDCQGQSCVEMYPDYVGEHVVAVSPDIAEVENVIVNVDVEPAQGLDDIPLEESVESTEGVVSTEKPAARTLTSADDVMSTGAVPLSTYTTYLKSVRSPVLVAAMVLSYLLANGAQFFQQYIVAKWTEIGKGDAMAAALGGKYLRSLVNAAGVVSVFLWLRSYLTMKAGVKASEFLHNKMLSSVFRAPMSFFDATPSGQLISRFGKELETVDRAVPDGFGSVIFCFLQIFLSSMALAGVITPAMAIPLGVVGVLYYHTTSRFRPAARDLKRSESKSRSPIYTHFGETLRGSEIIRSIPSARSNWSSQHRDLTDQNLSVFYTVKALDRWLSIRLETLGNAVVFAAAVASVFLTRVGRLKSGSAGWGLTQALSITGLLTWAVRTLTDLETNMLSVTRIKELTDMESEDAEGATEKMPRELSGAGDALASLHANTTALNVPLAPLTDTALVRDGWPWKGDVQFKGVSMRYNPISPLVLNNVTVSVPPGTTLGIVGRTGSGKSSLLLTLFRLVEIEGDGSIEIDDVDIRSVSLQTLRQSLAIIPQDPVLFAGTIYSNLDVTGKASREDAWAALEAASPDLAQQFRNAGTGLDTEVTEGGKSLSLGQRQLLCLARALLRKSKILVLDEATSSVDSKTDAEVQATIRREFVNKGVTVITVAHRLETVLGYDKIAVLGSGELLEYGTPSELLRNKRGELRRLVDADKQNKRKGAKSTPLVVA